MLIYIQDEILELNGESEQAEKILSTINDCLIRLDLQLSHLIVDETPVYDDLLSYLREHSGKIEKIEVLTKTIAQLVAETIDITFGYIKNAVPLVIKLAEEFYQQPDRASWHQLGDLFDGLQWIIETITKIDSIKNLSQIISNYEVWNEYVQEATQLSVVIPELEKAITGKDNIAIGDVLMYEVLPIYQKIASKLAHLMVD